MELKIITLGIGTKLYGYCNGYFHADYYAGYKTIEAFGKDWIVAREEDGYPNIANFYPYTLQDHVDDILRWTNEEEN